MVFFVEKSPFVKWRVGCIEFDELKNLASLKNYVTETLRIKQKINYIYYQERICFLKLSCFKFLIFKN